MTRIKSRILLKAMHLAQWPCLDCTGNDSTIVTQISILALLWYVSDAWGGSIPPRPQLERTLFYCKSSLLYSNILLFLLFMKNSSCKRLRTRRRQIKSRKEQLHNLAVISFRKKLCKSRANQTHLSLPRRSPISQPQNYGAMPGCQKAKKKPIGDL